MQALSAEKLAAANVQDPASVVARLAERRSRQEPLLEPKKPGGKGAEQAKQRADKLLATGYRLRKNPVWKPRPPIDWGSNPKEDANWHYLINSLNPTKRLLHAHRYGSGDRYYLAARQVALDWIDYNLVRDRPNKKKWHDMGSGFRAEVMSRVLDIELRRPKPDTHAVGLLVWVLNRHAKFLADPKVFTLGNHGVYMMRGLASVLKALPELKQAHKLGQYANHQMKKLVDSQFAADGYHLEHSPDYHFLITKTFQGLLNDKLFPDVPELAPRMKLARQHYGELRHPNGDIPMLGDSKSGPRKPTPAGTRADAAPLAESLRAYPQSGYAVVRSGFDKRATPADDYLLLGAGHHSRVHKHADHLSFEWSFRGVPILTDSGKFTYSSGKCRDFFESTRAGNSVEVDRKDYDRTPRKGHSQLEGWGTSDHLIYVVAAHFDQKLSVKQTRLLVMQLGEFLMVVDRMEGEEEHDFRQWFHFHEALELVRKDSRLMLRNPDGETLLWVEDLTQPKASVALVKGQTEPRIQGFVSHEYMKKQPRYALGLHKQAKNATWATLLSRQPVKLPQVKEEGKTLTVKWLDASGKPRGFSFTAGGKAAFRELK